MSSPTVKVALLTSGGDAPGMNAAIRAFVRYALSKNLEVFGIERGFSGLIEGKISLMNRRSVSDILQRGGTILKTARSDEFQTDAGMAKAHENLAALGIGGLCVIGGDGSFTGAMCFAQKYPDMRVACIPATIDNDLAYTQFSLGFDTAVNTVLEAINKLRDTMTSHDRACIVEVMGRSCGDIALYSGVGGGAEAILVPEIKYDVQRLAALVIENFNKGKASDIIVLAEGAGKAHELAIVLKALTNISMRCVVLGHIQRGGSPTNSDRMLGAQFGAAAVEVLLSGKNQAVGIVCGEIIREDISKALSKAKKLNMELYSLADVLAK